MAPHDDGAQSDRQPIGETTRADATQFAELYDVEPEIVPSEPEILAEVSAADQVDATRVDAPIKSGSIAVVLPARNEAEQIGATLEALLMQTKKPERIIVVINNCTDEGATAQRARSFAGVEVVEMTENPFMKAGALNRGVRLLLESPELPEFVLTMDADTVPDPDFLENATNVLDYRPEVGAISAVCDGKKGLGSNWREKSLAAVQQLEYARAGFTRVRLDIHTMSGAGSLIRMQAVLDVVRARGVLFAERADNVVEDFETTLAIKKAGWKVVNNYYCHVQTDLMLTVRDLMKQRIRWVHGTINELRRNGWTKETRLSILTLGIGILAIPLTWFWVALLAIQASSGNSHITDYWFLALVILFQAFSVYRLGFRKMALAALLVPELLYGLIRHTWIVVSLAKSFGRQRSRRLVRRSEVAW